MVCTTIFLFKLKTKLRAVTGQTDGATPLYAASEKGHVAVVKALVKAGATVDQATVWDRMPFSAAGGVWCARMSLVRRTRVESL